MAKPAVDGLERQLKDKALVARVDAFSEGSDTVAQKYGLGATPTYLVIAPNGEVLFRQVGGSPRVGEILEAVSRVSPPHRR